MRDFFASKEWYSPNKKAFKKILNTNIVTCFDSLAEKKENINMRSLAKFFVIGLNNYDLETSKAVFT